MSKAPKIKIRTSQSWDENAIDDDNQDTKPKKKSTPKKPAKETKVLLKEVKKTRKPKKQQEESDTGSEEESDSSGSSEGETGSDDENQPTNNQKRKEEDSESEESDGGNSDSEEDSITLKPTPPKKPPTPPMSKREIEPDSDSIEPNVLADLEEALGQPTASKSINSKLSLIGGQLQIEPSVLDSAESLKKTSLFLTKSDLAEINKNLSSFYQDFQKDLKKIQTIHQTIVNAYILTNYSSITEKSSSVLDEKNAIHVKNFTMLKTNTITKANKLKKKLPVLIGEINTSYKLFKNYKAGIPLNNATYNLSDYKVFIKLMLNIENAYITIKKTAASIPKNK